MILLEHNSSEVISIVDTDSKESLVINNSKAVVELFHLAKNNSKHVLVWYHESLKNVINIEGIKTSFYLKNMMFSYSLENYFPDQIGYIEDSPFLKINKKVKYPTWQMSSSVGVIHASQLLKFEKYIDKNDSFDYTLNAIARMGMSRGLFCYSEPKLLNEINNLMPSNQASKYELFKFVKQHYKSIWQFLLLINYIIYDKKFPFVSFLRTFFYEQKQVRLEIKLELLKAHNINNKPTIDVIIPTIGRKSYLFDVLMDLSTQTLLPKKVVVLEQNPSINSKSELDYIKAREWPFMIIHKFTHITGACNARNLGLDQVTSDYVYLADDDNKFDEHLLKTIVEKMQQYKLSVMTMSYLQEGELEVHNTPIQWSTFGAGSSVIDSDFVRGIRFDMTLEHGYGEDADFGMQLRNSGADIIYFPNVKIMHLKAPLGGFRTAFKHPWMASKIQPKPSPTVMLYRRNNLTPCQLLGYKTKLFIKFYKTQEIRNPMKYLKHFNMQWNTSLLWANKLTQL